MSMTKIWSKRFTIMKGDHWVFERATYPSNVEGWLTVFRKNEPGVLFTAQNTRPSEH